MKRYTHSAIILLAVLALVGCSKSDEFQHNPDSALQIESVSGISPFALTTKAVITGNTLPDSEAATGIGIFVTASDGSAYDGHDKGYTNVNFANSGSGWSTATPVYLSDTEGKLYGYFPYSGTANDLRAIPVQSSLNGTDYLYADPQTVSHSNKTVSLQMNHALSRLHLTIKKGANFTAEAPLSKITLKSSAIDATGTMDLTTGAITASKKSGETGTVELSTDGTITAVGIEKDILLVPADNSESKKDITIILAIGGKLASISLSGENGINIRSGIQNNVTLTIEDTGIKVTGVGVGEWGEGGSRQVQVGAHTVTVKLSEDAGIPGDLYVKTIIEDKSVIVKVYSDSGKPLIIREEDGKLLAPVEEGNKSTFTFSDVTEDITATLAYAKIFTVKASFNADLMPNVQGYPNDFGKSKEFIEGRKNIFKVDNVGGYKLDSLVCGKTKSVVDSIELKNIVTDTEVKAYYTYTDCLGGVFSVSKDTKVRFSRGNLWCEGTESNDTPTIKSWGFESNQFSTPSNRAIDHISHFMWCKSASESVKLRYAEQGTTNSDNLFTNASPTEPNVNFAVNGQKGFWRVLSGGTGGEWEYLISRKDSKGNALYNLGVKVCDSKNCLILLPDDWKWGENGVGSDWLSEYSESTTIKWSTMEAAGAVCLPAAGYRSGVPGSQRPALVSGVGGGGCCWSASPSNGNSAYDLNFNGGNVFPSSNNDRRQAYSVRLVTESK